LSPRNEHHYFRKSGMNLAGMLVAKVEHILLRE
jgi:hypothetical protein